MNSFYLVVHHKGIELNYFDKICDRNDRMFKICLKQGDRLEVTNEGFYVRGYGWFILSVINQYRCVYVSYIDIENSIQNKSILNLADLEFKVSLWRGQIDEALRIRNEDWFKFISRKLTSLKAIGSNFNLYV